MELRSIKDDLLTNQDNRPRVSVKAVNCELSDNRPLSRFWSRLKTYSTNAKNGKSRSELLYFENLGA